MILSSRVVILCCLFQTLKGVFIVMCVLIFYMLLQVLMEKIGIKRGNVVDNVNSMVVRMLLEIFFFLNLRRVKSIKKNQ